ncbi:hypothetical protein L596_003811 [Steinernema carpocapsae]|uniref:Uncharacterized protein n=1 Tax=Steinernema carpocapsae TaxID=34508 RepID=A0A4U8UUU0_STECR|nr:hypothetical protein L596_003811 [Steinernema carpocapsae]
MLQLRTIVVSSRESRDLTAASEGVCFVRDRWPTREELERNLRKILLIAPFTRHRCCLGCIALDDAVLLICVFQLIQLAVLSLVGAQLAVSDGYLFYTTLLEGHGSKIAFSIGFFVLLSVIIVAITLFAWAKQKPHLYLFHIVWQVAVVCIITGMIRLVFAHIKSPASNVPQEYQIIWPSAVVIIFFLAISALIQLWWIVVMVDAYFNQYTTTKHLGRTIAIVVPGLLRYPRPSHQFADEELSIEVPLNYAL